MNYVKLGATGLDVSPIAIGAMTYELQRIRDRIPGYTPA